MIAADVGVGHMRSDCVDAAFSAWLISAPKSQESQPAGSRTAGNFINLLTSFCGSKRNLGMNVVDKATFTYAKHGQCNTYLI